MKVVLSSEIHSWDSATLRNALAKRPARSVSASASGPGALCGSTSRSDSTTPMTIAISVSANVTSVWVPIICNSATCVRSHSSACCCRSAMSSGR